MSFPRSPPFSGYRIALSIPTPIIDDMAEGDLLGDDLDHDAVPCGSVERRLHFILELPGIRLLEMPPDHEPLGCWAIGVAFATTSRFCVLPSGARYRALAHWAVVRR